MPNPLNLFPARVPIGRGIDANGRSYDVLMTPEFSRALSDLLVRVGGVNGISIPELSEQIAEVIQNAAVIDAFMAVPQPASTPAMLFDDAPLHAQVAVLRAGLDDLQKTVALAPDGLAQIMVLKASVEELQRTVAAAPDAQAQVMGVRAGLEEVQRTVAAMPDASAAAASAIKELSRRPSTLAQVAIAASITGTLVETVLATVKVPAYALGRNGMLRITTTWSVTNSENNKTVSIKFGGTAISSSAVTTASTYQEQRIIQNRNATNSQVFILGGAGNTGAAIGTMAKDTTAPQNIDIAAQLSNIGETITLEAYTVELIPSAT